MDAPVCITENQQGEKTRPAPRRARYLQPLAHYPERFRDLLGLPDLPVRERALKCWIAEGRDATPPELPPFDDERRLKDWWTRVKKNRPPDWLVALAARPADVASPAVVAAAPSAPVVESDAVGPLFAQTATAPGAAAPTPVLVIPAATAGTLNGYAAALQRVREAEAAAGNLYTSLLRRAANSATTADDRSRLTAEAEQARRAWDELVNRLRPMEKDAADILRESGQVWNVDDVIASTTTIHLSLRDSLRGMWRRVRARMRSCATPIEEDALWAEETEKLFAGLRTNKFTRPVDDTAAAA